MYEEKAQKELRRNFFTIRVVQAWNKLPESVKAAESVNAFKNLYDRWIVSQRNERIG